MTAVPHVAQPLILQAFVYFQAIYFQAMGGGSKGCSLSSDMWLDCITKVELGEKTLPTLIQTNETKKSTQTDAFFESKAKIDAFLKIDANVQRQEYKMAS